MQARSGQRGEAPRGADSVSASAQVHGWSAVVLC